MDGAIHRAGGAAILEQCRKIRATQGECPAGQAVITGGGNLPARFVIHAVGPVWNGGGSGEDELLASAYRRSLEIGRMHGIKSISFPCISTGVYRFPADQAAAIAVKTVRDFVNDHETPGEVRFVVFSNRDFAIYQNLLAALSS